MIDFTQTAVVAQLRRWHTGTGTSQHYFKPLILILKDQIRIFCNNSSLFCQSSVIEDQILSPSKMCSLLKKRKEKSFIALLYFVHTDFPPPHTSLNHQVSYLFSPDPWSSLLFHEYSQQQFFLFPHTTLDMLPTEKQN